MSDKTRTRKTPSGIRGGRGRTTTTGAAAKRSGLQGKSRSRVVERKTALLQGASEEVVAATDMPEAQGSIEPTPFAASDEPEALSDQADGAPGNDTEAAAPDAVVSDTHASGASFGGSPGPGAAGQQPAEEPGEAAAASSGEATDGAPEVPKQAASGQAPSSASAEPERGSAPAPADEAAASLVPADAEGGSGPGGKQAPGRKTRAKKPAATGNTAPTPAKTRRRTRADAAAPQAADAVTRDAATYAEARPARRRRKRDSESASDPASKLGNKQDRTSAPRKSPDRKAPGRKAGASSKALSGEARAAEPTSAPRRGRKVAAGPAVTASPKAPDGDKTATPTSTSQAAPMPAAALPGTGRRADFFPAPGTGAGVMPDFGLLSSLSNAPTIASLPETHAVLSEAAEISRIGVDANMRAAEALAGARSPADLLARQADSMRILADAWMRQGARISDLWLRMMRASR